MLVNCETWSADALKCIHFFLLIKMDAQLMKERERMGMESEGRKAHPGILSNRLQWKAQSEHPFKDL